MPREIITLHVGQGGVQIGNACWELYCIEHGILPNGEKSVAKDPCSGYDAVETFFHETPASRYVPRCVFVDTEPSVIDEVRNNQYRELFRPDTLISGLEDAANNYARGYYTFGDTMSKEIMESVRRQADSTEALEGFFLFHTMGGGTGSGLTTIIMEELSKYYPKKHKLEFMVFPSPKLSTACVEPYNAVLSAHGTMELCDCGFMMDNESMYGICNNQLDLLNPTYGNINRLIAQVISSLTSPMRFDGSLNVDLLEFQTNLVPFPRIHFPLLSFAPFRNKAKAEREQVTVNQLTRMVFDTSNQMLKCDPSRGKYIACCLLYRGQVPPQEVYKSIGGIKQSHVKFVNWCPTGFKVGINFQPPIAVPGDNLATSDVALCNVANSTAIAEVWARMDYKFDLMFAKRSFVHWFTCEGMDEEEFITARENLTALERDFEECSRENPTD